MTILGKSLINNEIYRFCNETTEKSQYNNGPIKTIPSKLSVLVSTELTVYFQNKIKECLMDLIG